MSEKATDFEDFIQMALHGGGRKGTTENNSGSSRPEYGIPVPHLRLFVKTWASAHRTLMLDDWIAVLDVLYSGESVDHRLLAGMVLGEYKSLRQLMPLENFERWLRQLEGWKEIDGTCQSTFTADELLARWEAWRAFLQRLCASPNLNLQRASLVILIRSVRESSDERPVALAFAHIDALKSEKDKRIVKAISWVLREAIKLHRPRVENYLAVYVTSLPKTTIREVTTKLTFGKKNPR